MTYFFFLISPALKYGFPSFTPLFGNLDRHLLRHMKYKSDVDSKMIQELPPLYFTVLISHCKCFCLRKPPKS